MRADLAAQAAFVIWAGVVAYLSLTENPQTIETSFDLVRWLARLLGDEALSDKIGHFLSYAVLGALAASTRIRPFSNLAAGIAILTGYGLAIEALQGLGGVRTPDLWDGAADAFGAAAGLGGTLALRRAKRAA